MKNSHLTWFLLLTVAGLGALEVVYLAGRFPDAVDSEGKISLVYSVLLLAFLGGSAIVNRRRMQPGFMVYAILGWASLGLVLFTGYSYRYELAHKVRHSEIWSRGADWFEPKLWWVMLQLI